MSTLWIIHRSPRGRAALARLVGGADAATPGAPGDPVFDAEPAPKTVVLGLGAGDWEQELQFAHTVVRRAPDARWVVVAPRGARDAVRARFDTLQVDVLEDPPTPETLRARLRADAGPLAARLSDRTSREVVAERFSRWFADLELPGLLRALDPRMVDVPLLIRGEAGTGRGVLARYVHAFGGRTGASFVHIPCGADTSAHAILGDLRQAASAESSDLTVWLEDPDLAPRATQRALRDWVRGERALPVPARVRWIATAGEEGSQPDLDADVAAALAGLRLRVPPLRERPHLVEALAAETARAWCTARQERSRRLGEDALAVLEEYPWPGNLRELEDVVVQTLAACASDPVSADDLQREGQPLAPLQAGDLDAELLDDDLGFEPALATLEVEPRDASPASAPTVPQTAAIPERAGVPEGAGEPVKPAESAPRPDELALGRFMGALSHEVRNPLATIRTFASLLPERFDDPEFRERFAEMVREDVARIDDLVERLGRLSDLGTPARDKVDVASLLEALLESQRDVIRERRLLVLKELDAEQSLALGDRRHLELAFESLLAKCLDLVPERGDVYLASRRRGEINGTDLGVRVLLRFHDPNAIAQAPAIGVSVRETSLEFMVAEWLIEAQGGRLEVTSTEGEETLVIADLPLA